MSQSIEAILGMWSEGPGPLHRKLSDAVRSAADDGRLPPGERLPSERDLAARLALSRSTVVTAYDTLRSEGVVESRQGSGTRIRRRPVGHGPAPLVVSPIYRTLIDVRDDVISLACATFPAHPQVAQAAAVQHHVHGPRHMGRQRLELVLLARFATKLVSAKVSAKALRGCDRDIPVAANGERLGQAAIDSDTVRMANREQAPLCRESHATRPALSEVEGLTLDRCAAS